MLRPPLFVNPMSIGGGRGPSAVTTGAKRPTASSFNLNDAASGSLTNASNAYDTDTSTFASVAVTATAGAVATVFVDLKTFLYNLGRGKGMTGFEVILRLAESAGGQNATVQSIQLIGPTGVIGTAKTPGTALNTTQTNYAYGSSTDTWGLDKYQLSWIAANSSAYGIRVGFRVPANESATVRIYDVTGEMRFDTQPLWLGDTYWHNRYKVSSFAGHAQDNRVHVVFNGNSNAAFGGQGWTRHIEGGLTNPSYGNLSMWGTGILNVGTAQTAQTGWSIGGFGSLPQDGSVPSGISDIQPIDASAVALRQAGYVYEDSGTFPPNTGSSNASISTSCPLGVDGNLRWHGWYGTFNSGSGSFHPSYRGQFGASPSRTEFSIVNTNTGTIGMSKTTADLAAASRPNGLEIGFEVSGGTGSTEQGPFFWGNQRVENTDKTTGIAWTLRTALGGQPLRVQINEFLNDLTATQQTYLVKTLDRDAIGTNGKVVYWLHEGLNSRNDSTNSVGPNPAPGNTALGYADNCIAFMNKIEEIYTNEGIDLNSVEFVLSVDHQPDSTDSGGMPAFREVVKVLSDLRDRCAAIDFGTVFTYAELVANAWYDGGGSGSEHLAQAAYTAGGQRIALEMAARSNFKPSDMAMEVYYNTARSSMFTDAGVTPAVDTNTVYQLNDLSGNNRHALQTTAGDRPTLDSTGPGNKPTLRFTTAGTDWLDINHSMTAGTVLIVGQYDTAAFNVNNAGLFSAFGFGSPELYFLGFGGDVIFHSSRQADLNILVNGVDTDTVADLQTNNLFIGIDSTPSTFARWQISKDRNLARYWDGSLSLVAVKATPMTNKELNQWIYFIQREFPGVECAFV